MSESTTVKKGFSGLQVIMLSLLVMIITVAFTSWIILSDIFVTEFKPVTLDTQEEQVLSRKLNALGVETVTTDHQSGEKLEPEAYSETQADREIRFTEKEVNAILAKNTDLASKLAIDLSDNLMSAKFLLPLDEEMPFVGGKTLKVTAGVSLSYVENKPVVIVKGVSIWGVPVPAAYLGNIKNVDLIEQFEDSGFWKSFADGLENLQVDDGTILIKVKP